MNRKQIVFYCASHPFEMIYKIAKIFQEKGYETVLVTMSEKDRFNFDFYSDAFDRIICSNFQFFKPSLKTVPYIFKRGLSFIKFLISIKFLKPYVVIGITGANWQLKFLHKSFFKNFPFIYFPYDIISHFHNSEESALRVTKKFEIEAERYCFENANGIIHKGAPDELNYIAGRIHQKLKLPKSQLNFLPYCSNEFMVEANKNKLSKGDKAFHLVYIGGFPAPEFKSILNQGIHVHVYFTFKHVSEKQEGNYIDMVFRDIKNHKLFHSHNPLNPRELIPEISKYDFGFWTANPVDKNYIEPKFATGNKLASYLEAGIPFICNEELAFVNSLMRENGISIHFNKKNLGGLKKRLQKTNWKKIEKNLLAAREELSMEKNFPRLEKFVQEVAEDFERKNN